jgi:hypothetical protein
LVERRDDRFFVRKREEIARLFERAYGRDISVDRLMPGLANVAAALNGSDLCLAGLAAVHLKIPALPNRAARDALEAEDRLIKYARGEGTDTDWNPALHPRAGAPPNPGWFAPTGGSDNQPLATQTAQNDDPNRMTDAALNAGRNWVRLQPAKRIDELGDFAEWLANAKPEDEDAIRAEIKRYFDDVGWQSAAHDLNSKLSVVLRPGTTPGIRQKILDSIDLYTRVDPAEYVRINNLLSAAILGATDPAAKPGGPSPAWRLGWAKRGQIFDEEFRDPTFPANFPVIDRIPEGIATSVKSIDLNAATYHNEAGLTYRLQSYIAKVQDFDGDSWGGKEVRENEITGRAVMLIIPSGSMTEAQRTIIERVRTLSLLHNDKPVDVVIIER